MPSPKRKSARPVRFPALGRHKATGRAVVRIDGRDFYCGAFGTPEAQRAYESLIAQWIAGGRRMPSAAESGLTIAQLAAAFIRHADAYYRDAAGQPTGEAGNIRVALRPLIALFAALPAEKFGPLKLAAVRERLIAEGICRAKVNSHAGRIRRMFRWGVAQELIPAGVLHGLAALAGLRAGRSNAKETVPVLPVADAVVEATLPHLSNVVRAMVRVQRLCGKRPGEVVRMTTGEIDRSGDVWSYRPARHKGDWLGKARVVALGPRAQAVLRPFLRDDVPDAPLFAPAAALAEHRSKQSAVRKTPASCGNKPGSNRKTTPQRAPRERYDTQTCGRAIVTACERAFGMPAELRPRIRIAGEAIEQCRARRAQAATWRKKHCWAPNQLRHAAAPEARQRDGLEAAQLLLGHARADVTQVYAERDEARAAELARKYG